MGPAGRFAIAFVVCIGLAIGAVVGTISRSQDQDGLAVGELLRVEAPPAAESSVLADHLHYSFEILGGERAWTEADLTQRFTTQFQEVFSVPELQLGFTALRDDIGTVRFVRLIELHPDYVKALMVAENGVPFELEVGIDPVGRIGLWGFDEAPSPPPLQAWESSLMLLGGWLLIVGAGLAWRHGASGPAWMMLFASLPALAGVLTLSRTGALYTAGRSVPAVLAIFGVLLLLGGGISWRRLLGTVAGGAAMLAAIVGLAAPFFRDATLIGHSALVGPATNNEAVYRGLMSASAVLAALAFGVVAGVELRSIRREGPQLRPALWGAATVALVWAAAAVGAAVDFVLGEGLWASGPFRAASLSAVALVPAVAVFKLAAQRWARPELAALVIDLESEGADLQPAIAKALEDPSLQVLTSSDGLSLVSETGEVVEPARLPADRSLTRIQSGDELVGALVHSATLQQQPERLRAVAAAAGLAMQVSRLNQKVVAQLAEVDASRARILEASDGARRRVERDLHDGAQQRLVALGIRLQKARRIAATAQADELAGQLDEASAEVRDVLQEIRSVSRGAQPALLAERGLVPALDALAERTPVPVAMDIDAARLSADTERTAYFVIAEGLTNVAKHANATRAEVTLNCRGRVARIRICDNGDGGAAMAPRSGLEGLKDRVAAAGGEFSVSSGPAGTTLEAEIPCD